MRVSELKTASGGVSITAFSLKKMGVVVKFIPCEEILVVRWSCVKVHSLLYKVLIAKLVGKLKVANPFSFKSPVAFAQRTYVYFPVADLKAAHLLRGSAN